MYISEYDIKKFEESLKEHLPEEVWKCYKRSITLKNEKTMMQELGDLFVRFSKLERQHPNELSDFQDGIHKCQYVLGMRIARYHEPELLPEK